MIAIREIVTRDIFKNFEVPEEFGDEFEMILLPIKDLKNHYSTNDSNDSKSINSLDKWEKFGYWDPEEDTEFTINQNKSIFDSMEKEFGSEDKRVWQK